MTTTQSPPLPARPPPPASPPAAPVSAPAPAPTPAPAAVSAPAPVTAPAAAPAADPAEILEESSLFEGPAAADGTATAPNGNSGTPSTEGEKKPADVSRSEPAQVGSKPTVLAAHTKPPGTLPSSVEFHWLKAMFERVLGRIDRVETAVSSLAATVKQAFSHHQGGVTKLVTFHDNFGGGGYSKTSAASANANVAETAAEPSSSSYPFSSSTHISQTKYCPATSEKPTAAAAAAAAAATTIAAATAIAPIPTPAPREPPKPEETKQVSEPPVPTQSLFFTGKMKSVQINEDRLRRAAAMFSEESAADPGAKGRFTASAPASSSAVPSTFNEEKEKEFEELLRLGKKASVSKSFRTPYMKGGAFGKFTSPSTVKGKDHDDNKETKLTSSQENLILLAIESEKQGTASTPAAQDGTIVIKAPAPAPAQTLTQTPAQTPAQTSAQALVQAPAQTPAQDVNMTEEKKPAPEPAAPPAEKMQDIAPKPAQQESPQPQPNDTIVAATISPPLPTPQIAPGTEPTVPPPPPPSPVKEQEDVQKPVVVSVGSDIVLVQVKDSNKEETEKPKPPESVQKEMETRSERKEEVRREGEEAMKDDQTETHKEIVEVKKPPATVPVLIPPPKVAKPEEPTKKDVTSTTEHMEIDRPSETEKSAANLGPGNTVNDSSEKMELGPDSEKAVPAAEKDEEVLKPIPPVSADTSSVPKRMYTSTAATENEPAQEKPQDESPPARKKKAFDLVNKSYIRQSASEPLPAASEQKAAAGKSHDDSLPVAESSKSEEKPEEKEKSEEKKPEEEKEKSDEKPAEKPAGKSHDGGGDSESVRSQPHEEESSEPEKKPISEESAKVASEPAAEPAAELTAEPAAKPAESPDKSSPPPPPAPFEKKPEPEPAESNEPNMDTETQRASDPAKKPKSHSASEERSPSRPRRRLTRSAAKQDSAEQEKADHPAEEEKKTISAVLSATRNVSAYLAGKRKAAEHGRDHESAEHEPEREHSHENERGKSPGTPPGRAKRAIAHPKVELTFDVAAFNHLIEGYRSQAERAPVKVSLLKMRAEQIRKKKAASGWLEKDAPKATVKSSLSYPAALAHTFPCECEGAFAGLEKEKSVTCTLCGNTGKVGYSSVCAVLQKLLGLSEDLDQVFGSHCNPHVVGCGQDVLRTGGVEARLVPKGFRPALLLPRECS